MIKYWLITFSEKDVIGKDVTIIKSVVLVRAETVEEAISKTREYFKGVTEIIITKCKMCAVNEEK